jgi:HlyD family secretion protein
MKTSILLIGLGVVTLAAWAGFSFLGGGVPVQVAVVREDTIVEFVDEQAKTRLPRTYAITMPFAGRLSEITLSEGQAVRKDEVVARCMPLDLDLEQRAAQAAVDRLKAAVKENRQLYIEWTAWQQAQSYVEAMVLTVKAAEKRKAAGQARYEFARDVFERRRGLVNDTRTSGVITPEQLDEAQLQMKEADANFQQDELVHRSLQALQAATNLVPQMVMHYIERKGLEGEKLARERDQAQAQLDQVQLKLKRGEMKSPVDGVVLSRPQQNEQFLAAGTTLLEIGRVEELEIEADILSQDAIKVSEGDKVEIYGSALGQARVSGSVKRKYPGGFTKISSLGVEQQRVKVIVGFDSGVLAQLREEKRGLGVGYQVRVRIITDAKVGAVVVPRSALFRAADGRWQVFKVVGRRARLSDVQVGLMNDEHVQMVSGLRPEDRVILAPETNLRAGDRVSVE